ncbi:hypothetical protein DFP72DRAFT_260908 [Ephemerocybe angulata]|uniref:DUF6533 domain-containing protein n=1 Tax=Ephemerocybe angulata TaxID=980116 RepID=A0A8H6M8F2_9AGAR|nr:hypothetical protein DFP72DRAFT_260908 [Tulosesus angulatus]
MDADSLASSVRNARLVSYFNVASACIMVYDILITLGEEYRSIWTGRMGIMKILYLFARYSTVFEVGVVLWEQAVPGDWYRGCKISFDINVWLFVIGLGFGEMIMSMRTWAVWKRSKKLGIFLLIFWPVCWIAGFVIAGLFAKTVKFDPSPMSQFKGCFVTEASPILFIAFVILLLYDTVNLVLISIPAYNTYRRGGTSQLVRSVYTDGIVYYVYLFALSALNIIVIVKMPTDLVTLLSMMERVLHAVLTCRVVLHMHNVARQGHLFNSEEGAPSYQLRNVSGGKNLPAVPSKSTYESTLDSSRDLPKPQTHSGGMEIIVLK